MPSQFGDVNIWQVVPSERISVGFIRAILGQGGNTYLGTERANVQSPVRAPVITAAVSDNADVCRIAGKVTRATPLALRGN